MQAALIVNIIFCAVVVVAVVGPLSWAIRASHADRAFLVGSRD
jgi:hypothetical protein